MADAQKSYSPGIGFPLKYVNLGDDTYAPAVYVFGGGGGGGDASAANQVTGNASLASIDTKVTGLATQTTVAAILTRANLLLTEATGAAMSAKLPASLGPKTSALSFSTAPATDANVSRETYSAVTIMQATATGAAPVAFGAQACTSLDLVNASGVDIEYQRGGAGLYMTVPTGTSRLVQGITNANQIGVRRVDQVATNAVVKAEAFAV